MIIRLVFYAYLVSAFALMFLFVSKEEKFDKVIKIKDIELKFKRKKDIDKFINEYRELIGWLNNKYPSFEEDIKSDYWIERIIKDHEEVLVDLKNIMKLEEERNLICNKEKINKNLDSDNETNK